MDLVALGSRARHAPSRVPQNLHSGVVIRQKIQSGLLRPIARLSSPPNRDRFHSLCGLGAPSVEPYSPARWGADYYRMNPTAVPKIHAVTNIQIQSSQWAILSGAT
jgi:hypothetical protein